MRYYPIHLSIEGRLCVVIGGGRVAERKVKNILLCGGRARVVSPDLTGRLSRWAAQRRVDYVESKYHAVHLKGAFLVYAATSDRGVNAEVSRDAAGLGLLVDVADSRKESTFILPAVLRKRGMTIAVSTDGRSPARSVRIRDRLKDVIDNLIRTKD